MLNRDGAVRSIPILSSSISTSEFSFLERRSILTFLISYFIDLERESRTVSRTATLIPEKPPYSPIPPSPIITLDIPRAASPTPSDAGTEDHDEFEGCTTPAAAAQDAWGLNYFNYRTLSTFMEGRSTALALWLNCFVLMHVLVLDDDMNGLIKIKEVNEFTSAKPEDITLMQWIVYSAYGKLIARLPTTHLQLAVQAGSWPLISIAFELSV